MQVPYIRIEEVLKEKLLSFPCTGNILISSLHNWDMLVFNNSALFFFTTAFLSLVVASSQMVPNFPPLTLRRSVEKNMVVAIRCEAVSIF